MGLQQVLPLSVVKLVNLGISRFKMLSIPDLLAQKRDGVELCSDSISYWVNAVVSGESSRAQSAAFLAFVYQNGMTDAETVALTMAMANSGQRFEWTMDKSICDKHSTGGVGDKVSLVLAPLWAELSSAVPMISGRGLGHTGGTLDKLESIVGFQTDIPITRLRTILDEVNCFICGQTDDLAPADRILYALRNETATVPCIPLIVGSILSKKLAAGIHHLVLDVKWGSGAFMKTNADAVRLADALKRVGEGAGLTIRTQITDMNQPLGQAVGNAIEVEEAIRCLKGEGPEDLSKLVCSLIDHPEASSVLSSGRAYERFERMVHAQGGRLDEPFHGSGCQEWVYTSPCSGLITRCDAYDIGMASFVLGAGRAQAAHLIHPGVGIRLEAKAGVFVQKGQPLARVIHNDKGLQSAKELLARAYAITSE